MATISLAGCFGCHMSMLDIDLGLVDILDLVEFNKSPLNDIKEFTKICDIGLIEGGCCNTENIEVLREFRKKCKILVAMGECAIWGGLPAMRNTIPLVESVWKKPISTPLRPRKANTPSLTTRICRKSSIGFIPVLISLRLITISPVARLLRNTFGK